MPKTKLLFYSFLIIEGIFFVTLSYYLGFIFNKHFEIQKILKVGSVFLNIYIFGSMILYFIMLFVVYFFGRKIKKRICIFEKNFYSGTFKKNIVFGKNLIKFNCFILILLAPFAFGLILVLLWIDFDVLELLLGKFEDKDEII